MISLITGWWLQRGFGREREFQRDSVRRIIGSGGGERRTLVLCHCIPLDIESLASTLIFRNSIENLFHLFISFRK